MTDNDPRRIEDNAGAADIAAPPVQPTLFDLPTPPAPRSFAPTEAANDEDALTDMAAETDDSVPADSAEAETYAADEPNFAGLCRGGPYNGRTIASRFPNGFLLYDKPRQRMWTYIADAVRPGEFTVVGDGQATPVVSPDTLRPTAEGSQFDVIAYDDGPAMP
jgi:hypothetical protein